MNFAARKEAVEKAQAFLAQKPIYLDTETTGTGPSANIVEISIVDADGSILFDSLIKPVGKIEPGAQDVHGIGMEMLSEAPRWGAVYDEIEAILSGRLLGIYNADFDMRMMQQSHQVNFMRWENPPGMQVFCIMKLYAQFYGQWNSQRGSYRWQSLDAASQQCNIPLANTHRAKDDTLLTRALLQYMANY